MTATAKIRASYASNVTLVDHVRAQAGVAEAQFDATVCALFTAYRHVYKSGNKTQFNAFESAVKQYADIKECAALMGVKTSTSAVAKRANAVFLAYGAALAVCGSPSIMKEATAEELDSAAASVAEQFATMVTVALTPEAKPAVTAEEKEAKKAEKEKAQKAEAKKAEKELADKVKAEAEKIAQASVVSLADMVRIVANAIKTGQLYDVEAFETLNEALDSVSANVDYVVMPTAEEPAHA